MKKIRENITHENHETMMSILNGNTKIRENTKNNIKITLLFLYYTGMRINDVKQIRIKDLKEIVKTGEIILLTKKTGKERKLFFSKKAIREIKSVFNLALEKKESFIIRKKGNPSKTISDAVYIDTVNKFIQKSLNSDRYSSHSYRASLITELASKSIHPKIIADFMQQSVKTTMRYIRPTENDLKTCVIR